MPQEPDNLRRVGHALHEVSQLVELLGGRAELLLDARYTNLKEEGIFAGQTRVG